MHWRGKPATSATWEDLDEFCDKYLDFQLEDELDLEGGEMSCGDSRTADDGAPGTCGVLPCAQIARDWARSSQPQVVRRKDRISCYS